MDRGVDINGTMGKGFNIQWVGGSIYHRQGGSKYHR